MKRKIPMLCLLAVPYLYLGGAVWLLAAKGGLTFSALAALAGGCTACFLLVLLPCGLYAFALAKRGAAAGELLFWNMLLKLCNIPVYFLMAYLGVLMLSTILLGTLVGLLVCFDVVLLVPSTLYGIAGLRQAYREGRLTGGACLLHACLQCCFCTDVCSAVWLYVRTRKNKPATGAPPCV